MVDSGSLSSTVGGLVAVVALLCAHRVHLAAEERVSRLVCTTVWFSWVLSAVSLVLLPLDLAEQQSSPESSLHPSCETQPISALSVVWSCVFWCSIALGFVMVELLRE